MRASHASHWLPCFLVSIVLSACSGGDEPNRNQPGAGSSAAKPPAYVAAGVGGSTNAAGAGAVGGAAATGALGSAGQAARAGDPVVLPPEVGAAGQAGMPPDAIDGMQDAPGPALDECGLDTGFPGDEHCILPPPPDKGFQVHIGPASYDKPGQYLMQPGEESTEDFPAISSNDTRVYFYYRQYRMRPGSHHLIVSQSSGDLRAGGRRLGGSQNSVKDNPDRGIVAPENEGIGIPLDARVPLSVQLHYINTTSTPVLREAWINFWYVDPASVTQEAKEMFANGGLGMNVPAGSHTVLGPYSCPINQAGRVLSIYGHRHANAPRFSAWRVRGGQRQLIYESLDWAEPMVLELNSITTNIAPDRATGRQGGWSGVLDLQPGDALEWECEVQNEHNFALRFGNQTYDSEMCILIGDTVGPSVSCQHI